MLFLCANFGEDVAHRVGEHVHEFVKERFVEPERASVANRAPKDAAQYIIAVGVAGLDAVGNRKAQGADVVGDDAEGDVSNLCVIRCRRNFLLFIPIFNNPLSSRQG